MSCTTTSWSLRYGKNDMATVLRYHTPKDYKDLSVLSYRDSWRLFLRFAAARRAKPVAQLGLNDLTAIEVLAFLQNSEQERKVSIGTRNCRLAALRSFCPTQ